MQILESETLNKEIGKLLCKIKSGDNDAFCSFVDLTKKQLALSALAYLKSAGDIEDALQDTYIAVLTHIDSYVSNENPMGWVYRIFKNKCLSILRSRRGDLPLDFAVDIGAAFSFEDTDSMMLVKVLMETLSKKRKSRRIHETVAGHDLQGNCFGSTFVQSRRIPNLQTRNKKAGGKMLQ